MEIEEDLLTIILDIDGSAAPNPGFCGSGVHGYGFTSKAIGKKDGNKPKLKISENAIQKFIISDIGYLEEHLLAKYPSYNTVIPDFYIDGFFTLDNISTNNVAELNAFILSTDKLIIAMDNNDISNIKKLIFKTDSMYLLNVVRNIKANDNWKSDIGRVNYEYWVKIELALKALDALNIEVSFEKTLGHSGALGNHLADRLALLGRVESTRFNNEDMFVITPSKNYWNNEPDRHPFLSFKQLFFTNEVREKNKSMYAVMNYKKDQALGKKTHEACFGLVFLNNRIPLIEDSIDTFQSYLKTFSVLSTIDLSNLYSNFNFKYSTIFKNKNYIFNKNTNTLNSLEEMDVVSEIRPAGLATQALNRLMELHHIIKEYKTLNENNNIGRKYFDITNLFYGLDAKNKPVCIIKNGDSEIKTTFEFQDKKIDLTLLLGLDTIDRNALKRLEKDNVVVTLVVEQITPAYLSYYIILDMKTTGDISIWHNFYSNNILLINKKK